MTFCFFVSAVLTCTGVVQGIINAEDPESVENAQIAEFYRQLVGAGELSENWAESRKSDAATEERCTHFSYTVSAQSTMTCTNSRK